MARTQADAGQADTGPHGNLRGQVQYSVEAEGKHEPIPEYNVKTYPAVGSCHWWFPRPEHDCKCFSFPCPKREMVQLNWSGNNINTCWISSILAENLLLKGGFIPGRSLGPQQDLFGQNDGFGR